LRTAVVLLEYYSYLLLEILVRDHRARSQCKRIAALGFSHASSAQGLVPQCTTTAKQWVELHQPHHCQQIVVEKILSRRLGKVLVDKNNFTNFPLPPTSKHPLESPQLGDPNNTSSSGFGPEPIDSILATFFEKVGSYLDLSTASVLYLKGDSCFGVLLVTIRGCILRPCYAPS
jgi:hypothetical protein